MPDLDTLLTSGAPPLIAILRGVVPQEARAIGTALVGAGVRAIEVPANSPNWLASVAALAPLGEQGVLVGGGTVLEAEMVADLRAAGGRLVVAPDANPAVIAATLESGMDVLPGVMTPGEALAACRAGARHLKVFPAGSLARSHLAALASVLPSQTHLWAVGGVDADNAGDWIAAGARGVALGSSLYRPGMTAEECAARAATAVAALADARPN